MIRIALIATLCTVPALAQDADAAMQMREGVEACLIDLGASGPTSSFLAGKGWVADFEGEPGTMGFVPGAGDSTYLFIADTGELCHVESQTLALDAATTLLGEVLADSGLTVTATGTDAFLGCPTQTLSNGVTVELTSAGSDPTCTSDTTSALRFLYPTGG